MAEAGFLRTLLGDPEQATIRGGFSVAYNRNGMDEFRASSAATRGGRQRQPEHDQPAISCWPARRGRCSCARATASDRRRRSTARASAGHPAPGYPLLATIANSVNIFDPNIEVPFTHSYSLGLQRALSKDMVLEVRYVGTREPPRVDDGELERDQHLENGFLDEFSLAQANLRANVRGRGRPAGSVYVRVRGAGHRHLAAADLRGALQRACRRRKAGERRAYTGANWTNTTFVDSVAAQPGRLGSATQRQQRSVRQPDVPQRRHRGRACRPTSG